ncbi:DUF1496 domain-containing protein [Oceanisphaera sp. DM8]|uniref:DUF1496 domain-containing protein n=2 Tax=Oceanisphaera pacifica TaxID=2818389 RepID=A0ABS3NEW7_9GAMM|nr:DUF1496 domain-containing protein [Oceanisphaera pacifica]
MKVLVFFLLIISASVAANTVSTQPSLELNVNSGLERVCFYANQRYSKGAVIEVGTQLFVCEREKSYEQNGRLGWLPFPAASADSTKRN